MKSHNKLSLGILLFFFFIIWMMNSLHRKFLILNLTFDIFHFSVGLLNQKGKLKIQYFLYFILLQLIIENNKILNDNR